MTGRGREPELPRKLSRRLDTHLSAAGSADSVKDQLHVAQLNVAELAIDTNKYLPDARPIRLRQPYVKTPIRTAIQNRSTDLTCGAGEADFKQKDGWRNGSDTSVLAVARDERVRTAIRQRSVVDSPLLKAKSDTA